MKSSMLMILNNHARFRSCSLTQGLQSWNQLEVEIHWQLKALRRKSNGLNILKKEPPLTREKLAG